MAALSTHIILGYKTLWPQKAGRHDQPLCFISKQHTCGLASYYLDLPENLIRQPISSPCSTSKQHFCKVSWRHSILPYAYIEIPTHQQQVQSDLVAGGML